MTVGLAAAGLFDWAQVVPNVAAQTLGGFLGGVLVWLAYKDQFGITEDEGVKLAIFSTSPEIRNYLANVMTEAIGTLMLVFGILYMDSPGFFDTAHRPRGPSVSAQRIVRLSVFLGPYRWGHSGSIPGRRPHLIL